MVNEDAALLDRRVTHMTPASLFFRRLQLEPLKTFILEANQAEKWASDENWLEMKSFLKKVGSNRHLRAQTLTVSFKKP
jgi:hypothetical protein